MLTMMFSDVESLSLSLFDIQDWALVLGILLSSGESGLETGWGS